MPRRRGIIRVKQSRLGLDVRGAAGRALEATASTILGARGIVAGVAGLLAAGVVGQLVCSGGTTAEAMWSDIPSGGAIGQRLVFSDDFLGARLGRAWGVYQGQPLGDPGGYFLRSQVRVAYGELTIEASRKSEAGGRYATGGISLDRSQALT